jgi:hypothetical protein
MSLSPYSCVKVKKEKVNAFENMYWHMQISKSNNNKSQAFSSLTINFIVYINHYQSPNVSYIIQIVLN